MIILMEDTRVHRKALIGNSIAAILVNDALGL